MQNILTLAKQGFFDGQSFHRIIPGFVIQVPLGSVGTRELVG